MAKRVTVIGASAERNKLPEQKRLKVCGYARVSTGSSAQAGSYAAQVEYYTNKIQSNPLWEFVGVYADEATTGTKVKGRDEFQAMIEACEDGEIDLILTKSVTRFARNTVECIQTIRNLKDRGVGICFEKENINTLTEKSELLLTLLASIAQGESEDISGNNRWAVEKRFKDGTFTIGTPAYGYRKDDAGRLIVEEREAEVVRWIYETYLNGKGVHLIAKELNEKGIPTIRNSQEWKDNAVKDILSNPVYEGNCLQQKTYTEAQFPFIRKRNNGKRNQYLIEDDHPPIVTSDEAEAVRELMRFRTNSLNMGGEKYNNRYLLSGSILCEECGNHFRRQKIYIGKPYEKIKWVCVGHVRNIDTCQTKAIREDRIQEAFITLWNKLYTNQGILLEPLLKDLTELFDRRPKTEEIEKLDREIENLSEQSRILNQVMKKGYMDSAFYMENNSRLAYQLTECRRKRMLLSRSQRRTKEIVRTEQLIQLLKDREEPLKEFDEELFELTVKGIRISRQHDITFCLHNGLELTEAEGGDADAMAHADRI